jgi:Domain of unknown function (DUF4411)
VPAIYCIDTSCLIAAWDERYPIDSFPNFWRLMDGAIQAGKIVAPQAVHDETEKKSNDLHDWLADRKQMFLDLDEPTQREVRSILARHPRLVAEKKQRFAADPFIIATARLQGLTIVTEERPTGSMNRPNIPDVCSDYGLAYMNLLQLIRAEAWVI